MTMLDLSTYAALSAMGLLTANILLGLLLSTRYNPSTRWPRRRINLFAFHNWTGYIALVVAVLHPVLLLFCKKPTFRIIDILFPVWSPAQPLENTLGGLALYCLIFVVVTSYLRGRLGRRRWKAMHYVAYAAAVLFFIHGLFTTDPSVEHVRFDPFDAEKVAVELCLFSVVTASGLRLRYALRKVPTKPLASDALVAAPASLRELGTNPLGGDVAPTSRRSIIQPLSAPTRSWRGKLRVGGIYKETANINTFRLVPSETRELPFNFLPGQFLNLMVEKEGRVLRRSYTIASSPTQRGYCEISVKREEVGVISAHLHHAVHVGDEIEVEGPFGNFVFTGSEDPRIVLIGGGVGVTPLMSVLRFLTDRCWEGHVDVIYAAHAPGDFAFREELAALGHRHSNLRVHLTASVAGEDWRGGKGRVTKEMILEAAPEIATSRVHLCGPPSMMKAVAAALAELGVAPKNLRTESFGGSPDEANRSADVILGPEGDAAFPLVTFGRSNKSGRLAPGRTILELADALGVRIDGGCRLGVCGTCQVRLLDGEVLTEGDDALSPTERAEGIILACRAQARSDLTVDA